ncbi:MAG: 4-(cytidine 5'-diphospho)-2-C-methyl-D-erythritol kinase [Verrucomicrobia bacterium]|jgi:4-diphosphocytidyl-2-C-methyl-D-erythritol kinase|nr:4-(cytidine 5'-diphospho)-2-C-methyl-D-erythritol kinase [Verrucomicrobiota bacterium]
MTTLEKQSPGKVNLLLNILGKRTDGFHELETVIHPVNLCDRLTFERGGHGVALTCSDANLPADSSNLVHRAATVFLQAAQIAEGVRIHLEKQIPLAAGLGGGSGNAAATLLGLNELFSAPLPPETLHELAAALGSDVPFFLQTKPALATGRGEKIQPLDFFPALRGARFLLIHPGFGISTAWAYQNLGRFPAALNGQPGRAQELISLLQGGDLPAAGRAFYNSLEAPALEKYPLLALFQEFLRRHGAAATLMSGSGSTTFAIVHGVKAAETLREKFTERFGRTCWTAVVPA